LQIFNFFKVLELFWSKIFTIFSTNHATIIFVHLIVNKLHWPNLLETIEKIITLAPFVSLMDLLLGA
jgi:hypothetical protein